MDGNFIDQEVKKEYDPDELTALKFIEEWKVTAMPFAFSKNVYGICPVRRFFRDDDIDYETPLHKTTFLLFDTLENKKEVKKSDERMVLTNRIKYEYLFNITNIAEHHELEKLIHGHLQYENNANLVLATDNAPYFNNYSHRQLVRAITENVLAGQVNAYDYYSQKKLTRDETLSRIVHSDTILIENFDGEFEEQISKNNISNEIHSVIFIEEWFIDPETLRMRKDVIGIAPVRYYYPYYDKEPETPYRKILFTIYFDEKRKF